MGAYFDLAKLHLYGRTQKHAFIPNTIHLLRANVRLTEKCNARCITCDYWKKKWTDKLSTQQAVDLIHELRAIGAKRLRFTGGETLLRNDFFEILSRIEHLKFNKITLATNGLLLDKYHRQINNSCLTDLGVSIDGLAETNDRIRGIDGYFNRVMNAVELIKGKRITIMSTIGSWIADELEELFNIMEEKALLWDVNLPDNKTYFLNGVDTKQFWPSPTQVDKIITIIKKHLDKSLLKRMSDDQINYMHDYLKRKKIPEPPCFLGFTDIGIGSGGEVYSGCYAMPPVGNVLEQSLHSILTSKSYKDRLIKMLNRNCPGCNCGYEMNLIIENLPARICKAIAGKGLK